MTAFELRTTRNRRRVIYFFPFLLFPFFFAPPPPTPGPLVHGSSDISDLQILSCLRRDSGVLNMSSTIPYKLLSSLDTDTLGPRASVGRR